MKKLECQCCEGLLNKGKLIKINGGHVICEGCFTVLSEVFKNMEPAKVTFTNESGFNKTYEVDFTKEFKKVM